MEVDSNHETLKVVRHKLLEPNFDKNDFADDIPIAKLVIVMEIFKVVGNGIKLDVIQTHLNMRMIATDREVGSPNKFENVA